MKPGRIMRIGLSGAANCGKSTLAEQISVQFGVPVIEEKFRVLRKRIRSAKSPNEFLNAFVSTLEEKEEAEARCDGGFVADRTPIDLFVYLCTFSPQLLNSVPSKNILAFQKRAEAYCQKYDVLIIPPWGVVSYKDLSSWKPGAESLKMNPWTNYTRHMIVLSVAQSWMQNGKVITPPADIVLGGNVGDWLKDSTDRLNWKTQLI